MLPFAPVRCRTLLNGGIPPHLLVAHARATPYLTFQLPTSVACVKACSARAAYLKLPEIHTSVSALTAPRHLVLRLAGVGVDQAGGFVRTDAPLKLHAPDVSVLKRRSLAQAGASLNVACHSPELAACFARRTFCAADTTAPEAA